MSGLPTEETEVLLKAVLLLLLCELAVFTELGAKVGVGILLVSIATARVSISGMTRVTRVALSTTVVFILVGILSSVVIGITLPLFVRMFVLIGGQIFSGHLRAMLPISEVNCKIFTLLSSFSFITVELEPDIL